MVQPWTYASAGSGGDYSTVDAALTALQNSGTWTANVEIELLSDTAGDDLGLDLGTVDMAGFSLRIYTAVANRGNGGRDLYQIPCSNATGAIRIAASSMSNAVFIFDGVWIDSGGYDVLNGFNGSINLSILDCYLTGDGGGTTGVVVDPSNEVADFTMENTILHIARGRGVDLRTITGTGTITNCLCINDGVGDYGLLIDSAITVEATGVFGWSTGDILRAGGGGTVNYCMTSTSAVTGTGNVGGAELIDAADTKAATYALIVQELLSGSEDYRLYDNASNDAIDFASSGTSTDQLGTSRDATPDVGPFEIVSGGATDHDLGTPPNLVSASFVGTPAIAQTHSFAAAALAAATFVGAPSLDGAAGLEAPDIASATYVGGPTLAQEHALSGSGISSATSIGSPSITEEYSFTGSGIASGSFVGSPAITQVHAITANVLASLSYVGEPTAAQDGEIAFSAGNLAIAVYQGSPSLTQDSALAGSGAFVSSEVGSPILTILADVGGSIFVEVAGGDLSFTDITDGTGEGFTDHFWFEGSIALSDATEHLLRRPFSNEIALTTDMRLAVSQSFLESVTLADARVFAFYPSIADSLALGAEFLGEAGYGELGYGEGGYGGEWSDVG